MAKSNGELIAKARQMAEDIGRRAATVQEARELLALPSIKAGSSATKRVAPGGAPSNDPGPAEVST
jgi:hypothetical protein